MVANGSSGEPTEPPRFRNATRIHWTVLLLAFLVSIYLAFVNPINFPLGFVQDLARTVLTITATLLGFVFAFYTFYVTIIETRRDRALGRAQRAEEVREEERVAHELSAALDPLYKESEVWFSNLMKIFAASYTLVIFIVYTSYIQAFNQQWNPTYFAFSTAFTIASLPVTVVDLVVVLWLISLEVAGRSKAVQAEIMGRPKVREASVTRQLLQPLLNLRVTLIFSLGYVLVNYTYVVVFRAYVFNALTIFLVSPFNLLENLTPVYVSPYAGLANNYLAVALILATAETYSRYVQRSFRRYITIDSAFWLSIVASYVTSGLSWLVSGKLVAGTSIIGFSVSLTFLAVALLDSRHYLPKESKAKPISKIAWGAILATLIGVVPTYVYGNPSALVHLSGIAIFIAVVLLMNTLRRTRKKHRKQIAKTSDIAAVGSSPSERMDNSTSEV